MRILCAVAIASTLATAPGITAPPAATKAANVNSGSDCPKAAPYIAHGGRWQGEPVRPQKLGELPPAETYAAVVRHDERGCMVLVKYRDVRR